MSAPWVNNMTTRSRLAGLGSRRWNQPGAVLTRGFGLYPAANLCRSLRGGITVAGSKPSRRRGNETQILRKSATTRELRPWDSIREPERRPPTRRGSSSSRTGCRAGGRRPPPTALSSRGRLATGVPTSSLPAALATRYPTKSDSIRPLKPVRPGNRGLLADLLPGAKLPNEPKYTLPSRHFCNLGQVHSARIPQRSRRELSHAACRALAGPLCPVPPARTANSGVAAV